MVWYKWSYLNAIAIWQEWYMDECYAQDFIRFVDQINIMFYPQTILNVYNKRYEHR